jgi:adenylate cyclase
MDKEKIFPVLKISGIALAMAAIISILFYIGFYSNLDISVSDNLYGGKTPLNNIVIVTIDDDSIQEIGRWPWDRTVFAELLPWLNQSKTIGIDVAFFEHSNLESDAELADAVKLAGNVVMPVEYTEYKADDDQIIGTKMLKTIPEVAEDAKALGYINVVTDFDGRTRALNPNVIGDYKSFTYEIYKSSWKVDIEKTMEDFQYRMLINYVGQPGSFKRYKTIDVLNGKYDPAEFKGKIVLIGSTSPDLHDDMIVPGAPKAMPGVEVHANIIQTMITQKFLAKQPKWSVVIALAIAALGAAFAFYFLPVWLSTLIVVLAMFAYFFLAIVMFNFGYILTIIYVPITMITSYLVTTLYYYMAEKQQRKKVLGAFEKYVSKDVINHILENPDRLKLGGERRQITVFFSDIRGFTTISEKLSPEELVKLLNEYLTAMTNIVLKNNGVVDKYMGDAIMAFWGAPLDQPRHAEMACNTALEMETKLKEMQKKWAKDGVSNIEIGIGLNSGQAVVGNMGSENRFDYTAMGDTVNLGSRLEGLNKNYGTRIIISETTKNLLDTKTFMFRKLDLVAVKGKNKPIMIYELSAKKEDEESWFKPLLDKFEEGIEHYFKQEWDPAIKCFKQALKIRKDGKEDGPSKTFIERCEYFKEHPPGKEWDGVCVMKTK